MTYIIKTVIKFYIAISFICSTCLVLANNEGTGGITVVPEKLGVAEFYEKYVAIGECRFASGKDYFARVNGKVNYILDSANGKVSKGDIIIAIDEDIAERLKTQAEANLYLAESNYLRDSLLFKKKVISEEVIIKSKSTMEQARSEYAKALSNYDDMIIQAPDDGEVGVIKAKVKDEVKSGDYLFSLITKSNFHVFVELPESMRRRILITDIVKAKTPQGEEITGKILAISDYLSNNGTITAKLEFPYTDELIHGSFIETEFIFNKHTALALPEKAVLKNNRGNFVYAIAKDNQVKQIFVTLGVRTDNRIELLSNELKEGDLIVIDGLTKIIDGSKVTLIEKDEVGS